LANFLACWRLIYAIISSSPNNSSSSTPEGAGDGDDKDWRLEDADVVLNKLDDELPTCALEGVDDSLGLSSFRDFDGDKTESRLVRGAGSVCTGGSIAMDPVEDLRRPVNDMESRVDLRGSAVLDNELGTVRGTREVDCGDARTDVRCVDGVT
jgi:hypothetical protein